MARGSLGLRQYPAGTIFSAGASAGVIRYAGRSRAPPLNCRLSSFLVLRDRAKIQLNESYVARLPAPNCAQTPCPSLGCVSRLNRLLIERHPRSGPLIFGPAIPKSWRQSQLSYIASRELADARFSTLTAFGATIWRPCWRRPVSLLRRLATRLIAGYDQAPPDLTSFLQP